MQASHRPTPIAAEHTSVVGKADGKAEGNLLELATGNPVGYLLLDELTGKLVGHAVGNLLSATGNRVATGNLVGHLVVEDGNLVVAFCVGYLLAGTGNYDG